MSRHTYKQADYTILHPC